MGKLEKIICIRLDMEVYRQLLEATADKHQRKSDLLRTLINDYLGSHYHKTDGEKYSKLKMNDKNIFLSQMERIIPLIDSDQSKSEFVKAFFKRELGIDDLESSVISIQRISSKMFYYLILSMLIEYSNELETNDKYNQD